MKLPKLHVRFSLKLLLIFTGLIGFLLIPFCIKLERARKQKELVEEIQRRGGTVVYDWRYDFLAFYPTADSPPKETVLRKCLGSDFFDTVAAVYLNHGNLN